VSKVYVHAIAALRPAAVVNVEPCYEHCSSSTLTGLLRRRYIEINDYNRNLMSVCVHSRPLARWKLWKKYRPSIGIIALPVPSSYGFRASEL